MATTTNPDSTIHVLRQINAARADYLRTEAAIRMATERIVAEFRRPKA